MTATKIIGESSETEKLLKAAFGGGGGGGGGGSNGNGGNFVSHELSL